MHCANIREITQAKSRFVGMLTRKAKVVKISRTQPSVVPA